MNHPNIVRLYGTFICPERKYYLVLEYVAGGSLDSYIKKKKDELKQTDLMNMAFQIATGMRYLHQKGIIHRDLALRNLLIDEKLENGNRSLSVKISGFEFFFFVTFKLINDILDFGMSRVEEIYTSKSKEMPIKVCNFFIQLDVITSSKKNQWSAPESIKHNEFSKKR